MSQQKIEVVQDSRKPVAQLFAALADPNQPGKVLGVPVPRVRDCKGDVNGRGSVPPPGVCGDANTRRKTGHPVGGSHAPLRFAAETYDFPEECLINPFVVRVHFADPASAARLAMRRS